MNNQDSENTEIITVRAEPIELFKVLKLDGVVSGGGEAKLLIADGQVQLNGEVETRKRKKVFNNDIIQYLDRKILVVVDTPPPINES